MVRAGPLAFNEMISPRPKSRDRETPVKKSHIDVAEKISNPMFLWNVFGAHILSIEEFAQKSSYPERR